MPALDVYSTGKKSVLLFDTTEPLEFSQCIEGGSTRLRGAVDLHSTENGSPAVPVTFLSSISGLVGSAK